MTLTSRTLLASTFLSAGLCSTRLAHADEPPPPNPALVHASSVADPNVPASSPATPSSDATAPAPAAKTKWAMPIGLRADGGYTLRSLMEIPVKGADMGLAIGAQPSRHFAIWGVTRLMFGSTENGLSVSTWRLGADFDLVVDRVRFSPGVNFFLVGVTRAVRDDTIYSWGPAAHVGARVDVIRDDSFAIFGRADIDVGFEVHNNSAYWGPTFGAGVDFDLAGDRSSYSRDRE